MDTQALAPDEIDDILYLVRANESEELHQLLPDLSRKYSTTVQNILSAAKDPSTGNTPLHFCSANGLVDLLPTLLFPTNSNVQNSEGNTPLHWAAYNGHLAVVKALIAGGADMWIKNSAGHLPMFEAERADRGEVVQFLLEQGGQEVERTGRDGEVDGEDAKDVEEVVARAEMNGEGSSDG